MLLQDDFTVSRVTFCYKKKIEETYVLNQSSRPCHGVTLVLSGELHLHFSDEVLVAPAGSIIIHRKGDSYRLTTVGGGAEYIVASYLCYPSETVDSLVAEGRIRSAGENLSRYTEAFRRASSTDFVTDGWLSAMRRSALLEILCYLIRDAVVTDQSIRDPAAAAKRYMDEFFHSPLTVESVAHTVGLSPSHLRKLFRESYGISPNKYLNSVRVERAKEMISSGLFSLAEVAEACGFKNVYYFSRVFKEYAGVSPGRF